MKILIMSTNRSSLPVPVMPIGACMVAEAAEMAGHNVKVLDLIFERDPLRALEFELTRDNPDIVGLSDSQLQVTRDVLAKCGNMSSPTVLFVLHEILEKGISPGDWCIMVTFGAGLCVHAMLLRKE